MSLISIADDSGSGFQSNATGCKQPTLRLLMIVEFMFCMQF
jgi:hypothetical protein